MELKKVKKSRKVIFVILSIFCIVLSFLSPIKSYAADYSVIDGNLNDLFTFPSLPMQNTDNDKPICVLNSSGFNYMKSYYQSDQPNFSISSSLGAVNYGHYFMTVGASDNYAFYFLPEDSFVVSNNNSYRFYLPKDFKDTYGGNIACYGIERGLPNSAFRSDSQDRTATVAVTIDGEEYYYYSSSPYNMAIMASDLPIYYSSNTIIDSLDGLSQVNDNYTPSNPVEDHMTLREGSGIYLNNTTCDDGDVVIVVIPDEKQTTDNGYKIRWTCQATYVVNLPNLTNSNTIGMKKTLSRYGINAQVGNNSINDAQYYYNDFAYMDLNIDTVGNTGGYIEDFHVTNERLKYNGTSLSYISSKIASDGNWTDSATNGLAAAGTTIRGISIADLGSISVDTSGLASLLTDEYTVSNISYNFTLSLLKDGEVVSSNTYPYTLASTTGNTGAGTPYGNLIGSDSDYESAGTKNMGSGEYNQDYAPRNDVSVTGGGGSSSSSNNSSQGGSGGDANVTNTEGDNNVVVNTGSQNVTVNNDNGTAKYVPTILNKLLPNSEGDGGLSNDVQDLVNSNGWVTFMKTTYSFIPAAFWDKIVLYFGACLTITACAFLLRIILDLL